VDSPQSLALQGSSWVGAQHLIGNVWEWCSSLYRPYPYQNNPDHEVLGNRKINRVLRGGSFTSNAYELRAAYRNGFVRTDQHDTIGGRCVR
jgi:formylglycine-generating enzyme required for sulfatase activity